MKRFSTIDPTRTLTLRKRAIAQVDRRFNRIKKAVTESIVGNDILGNAEAAPKRRFVFLRDPDKLDEFNAWLEEQIRLEILDEKLAAAAILLNPELKDKRNNWLNVFIGAGYVSGIKAARQSFYKSSATRGRSYVAKGDLPKETIFANPAHTERAEFIYTRVYAGLKGVSQTMANQMSRVLADGIIRGDSPNEIARKLNDRVDKIGRTRARLIARTEIINAHQSASIIEGQELANLLGEEVLYQWHTSLDGRERPSHRARHRKKYTKRKVETLIGEPNCRCAVSPITHDSGDD